MEVTVPIPSTLSIGGVSALVQYRGQVPTCFGCGAPRHVGKCGGGVEVSGSAEEESVVIESAVENVEEVVVVEDIGSVEVEAAGEEIEVDEDVVESLLEMVEARAEEEELADDEDELADDEDESEDEFEIKIQKALDGVTEVYVSPFSQERKAGLNLQFRRDEVVKCHVITNMDVTMTLDELHEVDDVLNNDKHAGFLYHNKTVEEVTYIREQYPNLMGPLEQWVPYIPGPS